jgi:hypothetical protein
MWNNVLIKVIFDNNLKVLIKDADFGRFKEKK